MTASMWRCTTAPAPDRAGATGSDFTWYWREKLPVAGAWHQMTSRLNLPTTGNPSLSAPTFVGYNTPGSYTSIP